ncbi:hypothetical protein HPB50_025896 [Hyalomma asiaticum]|uniref:Uncharacterized protein n=1 Tax=Hyalomma asiaticum TaxID=266040 RepID=A0ACB7S013_HYAAI|nr:hypothetical protein HPB50_025896 [Hyalomma asiaticum]
MTALKELLVKGHRCLVIDPQEQQVKIRLHWLLHGVAVEDVRTALAAFGKSPTTGPSVPTEDPWGPAINITESPTTGPSVPTEDPWGPAINITERAQSSAVDKLISGEIRQLSHMRRSTFYTGSTPALAEPWTNVRKDWGDRKSTLLFQAHTGSLNTQLRRHEMFDADMPCQLRGVLEEPANHIMKDFPRLPTESRTTLTLWPSFWLSPMTLNQVLAEPIK